MATDSASSEPALERLRRHLRERAGDGECYCKSKFLAEELDLSSREVGALLGRLRERDTELEIERWAYTSATTWRVTVDRE